MFQFKNFTFVYGNFLKLNEYIFVLTSKGNHGRSRTFYYKNYINQ